MNHTAQYNKKFKMAVGVSIFAMLSACGGGAGSGATGTSTSAEELVLADDSPITLVQTDFVPTPGNGLAISYADDFEGMGSNDEYIDEQWQYMQTCLEVSAQEPLVTVVDSQITPAESTDDVIRHINGQILASSNVTETNVEIQVHSLDFDGSVGNPGHNMRSIMGRYLWLANSLSEGDYPYECANNG